MLNKFRYYPEGKFLMNKADDGEGGGGANPPADDQNKPKTPPLDGENDDPQDDPLDESKWDDKTKAYIKKLRGENAKYRTGKNAAEQTKSELEKKFTDAQKAMRQALGLDPEDEVDPKEAAQSYAQQVQELQFKQSCTDLALENGITNKDQIGYLEFLLTRELDSLAENEEITEDRLAELVEKAKGVGPKAGSSSTSVNSKSKDGDGGQRQPPPSDSGGNVTAEQFAKMSMGEQGKLHATNPDLYKSLREEAMKKGIYI